MAFDPMAQRRILGRFATGVTVVTARRGADLHGMTANAVASLSLDPPLVLVSVDKKAGMHAVLTEADGFAVNILAADQEALSRRFAAPGPKEFGDLQWTSGVTGAPILGGTLAYVECRRASILPGGDHDLFLGEIVAGDAHDGLPLLFYGGRYRQLAE